MELNRPVLLDFIKTLSPDQQKIFKSLDKDAQIRVIKGSNEFSNVFKDIMKKHGLSWKETIDNNGNEKENFGPYKPNFTNRESTTFDTNDNWNYADSYHINPDYNSMANSNKPPQIGDTFRSLVMKDIKGDNPVGAFKAFFRGYSDKDKEEWEKKYWAEREEKLGVDWLTPKDNTEEAWKASYGEGSELDEQIKSHQATVTKLAMTVGLAKNKDGTLKNPDNFDNVAEAEQQRIDDVEYLKRLTQTAQAQRGLSETMEAKASKKFDAAKQQNKMQLLGQSRIKEEVDLHDREFKKWEEGKQQDRYNQAGLVLGGISDMFGNFYHGWKNGKYNRNRNKNE